MELPLALTEADFCGSLCVPVEEGHCVVLILLTKQAKTSPGEVKITADGLRLQDKGGSTPNSLQEAVAGITNAAAKLQGDIATDGSLIEQIIAFLSGANLKILAPRAKIEAVKGPGGTIIGYFQGESLVQFVVTVALMAEGPVTHYLDLPFPAILGGVQGERLAKRGDGLSIVPCLYQLGTEDGPRVRVLGVNREGRAGRFHCPDWEHLHVFALLIKKTIILFP